MLLPAAGILGHKMKTSTTNPDNIKLDDTNFVLCTPSDIHKAWKSTAALKGMTMHKYCLVALRHAIQQDLIKMRE